MRDAIEQSLYKFSALSVDGREVPLEQFEGKMLVIVNTASKCGFTPQYAGLEALYRQYKDRGLVILGFPCNQFGAQEPGTESEITQFCESRYGVSFPIFAKIEVNGPDAHPLYKFLKQQQSGVLRLRAIRWNFTKFLADRTGKVIGRFAPATPPAKMAPAIEKALSV